MKNSYKVIITTSGTGSRLGEVTHFLNKALVRVGKKAAISYILDQIPAEVPIVVTVGYKKEQVKEFLLFAHPERRFEFVEVDKYEGEGSSLGYSLLCAAPLLQCPFVYVTCDTLFSMPITFPDTNWMGIARHADAHHYMSVQLNGMGFIDQIFSKGAGKFDAVYIGLAAISHYASFWSHLSALYSQNPYDQSLNDVRAFSAMQEEGLLFEGKYVHNWLDIGNEHSLQQARLQITDPFDNLEKLDESIYLFEGQFVIKFFHDPLLVKKRIARAKQLDSLVPKIEKEGDNFYRYQYVQGKLFSQVVNAQNIKTLLAWCQNYLWKPVDLDRQEKESFQKHCHHFYFEKSVARINQFYEISHVRDRSCSINEQTIPSLADLFSMIDWERMRDGTATGFHGDLHFENIILGKGTFHLLDWRQDFDGLIAYGDIYYDLAKLNHGMIVSHEMVRKNLFHIEIGDDQEKNIHCEILRPDSLVLCQQAFYHFLKEEGFDIYKVDILTALIFLNSAPLHLFPYSLFLHFFGRLRLWYALSHHPAQIPLFM